MKILNKNAVLIFTFTCHCISQKTGKLQQIVHLFFSISFLNYWIFNLPAFWFNDDLRNGGLTSQRLIISQRFAKKSCFYVSICSRLKMEYTILQQFQLGLNARILYKVISDISSMLLFVTASLTVNSDVNYHSVYCNVYSDNIMYERFCQTSLCLRSMRIFLRHDVSRIFDMVCLKYSFLFWIPFWIPFE